MTFEKFVYFFIPAWVGKTLLKIGPTFSDFAFKRSKQFVNNKNDDSEASKKFKIINFGKKNPGCTAVIRPEFKFPTKIDCAFTQILAIKW